MPAVNSHTLLKLDETGLGAGGSPTLLLTWQWKIYYTSFPVLCVTISSTSRWRLTSYINLKCFISTTTLHLSSLWSLWHTAGGVLSTTCDTTTPISSTFCPKPSPFTGQRATSAGSLLVSEPQWNSDDKMYSGIIYMHIKQCYRGRVADTGAFMLLTGQTRCLATHTHTLTHAHTHTHAHMQTKDIAKVLQCCRWTPFQPVWWSD